MNPESLLTYIPLEVPVDVVAKRVTERGFGFDLWLDVHPELTSVPGMSRFFNIVYPNGRFMMGVAEFDGGAYIHRAAVGRFQKWFMEEAVG